MAFGIVNVGQTAEERNDVLTNEQVGVPGGLATLNADGELTESQRWDIDAYTKAQADQKTADAVSAHNSSPTAHPAILARLAEVETEVEAINLKFGTEVNGNPFTVTFVTLDDVTAYLRGLLETGPARPDGTAPED